MAKSCPFIVHVDRMRRYLHESADSSADKLPVSDTLDALSRPSKSSGRMLRGRSNANTPSEPTITDQSVKSSTTARPVDSTMSTPIDGAQATAATTVPAAEVIDSITDTDTAVAGMSGARPASTSTPDKPTLCSDTTGSNIQVNSTNSDVAVAGAQDLNVSVDVKNRPRPPRPIRPQRIRRKPARLIDQVSTRQFKNWDHQPFRVGSPFWLNVSSCQIRNPVVYSTQDRAKCRHVNGNRPSEYWKRPNRRLSWRCHRQTSHVLDRRPTRSSTPAMTPLPPSSDEPKTAAADEGAATEAKPSTSTTTEQPTEVRGSMSGTGDGEASAQPSTTGSASQISVTLRMLRSQPEPVYKAQSCRLGDRDTVYLMRSGLSNHAVVHHGCWYSANRDEYMPIPEEELEEKCRAVQKGHAHRRRRPDPADTSRGPTAQGKHRKRPFSGTRAPKQRKSGEFVIPKLTPSRQDAPETSSGRETRRPLMYSESRPLFKRHEDRHERSSQSSSSGEYWKPLPSKTRRPEGFP